ncbi:MAG: SDR family oxidoreductase [Alphaproteobacteria bacterium]
MSKTVIIFGHGYVSKFLIQQLNAFGCVVYCTSRKVDIGRPVKNENVTIINFLDPSLISLIKSSNVLLSTVPPNNEIIDPVLDEYADIISKGIFEWIGYLSSTSVYGDHHGAWVDEETKCAPSNEKSRIRLLAEQQWLELYSKNKLPVHVLRLSGIYGPNRNCLKQIKNGKDFTIIKKDQFFSRIHVEDICMAIIASIKSPTAGEIYNVSDDEPAPINIVQQFGASILNANSLKEIPFEVSTLSDQTKFFFNDNKKVSNKKIMKKLNIKWIYPNYLVGLTKGCLPDLSNT